MYLLIDFLDRVNPDDQPGGYGGIDTESLTTTLCIILLIACLVMFFYIIYLYYKIDKIKENNEKENDKENETK